MRTYRTRVLLTILFLVLTVAAVRDASAVGLKLEDCIKCHSNIVSLVEGKGFRHHSEVSCLDCHTTHPPEEDGAIPACAMCHATADKQHYALKSCIECHNPHSPLDIDFAKTDAVSPVCSSCHVPEGKQLADYPSLHSELDCTECHSNHGSWLSCLDCHAAHNTEMSHDTCLRCHKPHMPSVVKYDADIPNLWCSGCHGGVVKQLAENRSKHHALRCVYCHRDQHRMRPSCETCHGQPHTSVIHKKFPDCRECHLGPHNLDMQP